MGCCILEEQPEGELCPTRYLSRSLTKPERVYSAAEGKHLTVVWAILQLRPYGKSAQFALRTTHQELPWILNLGDGCGRLARWRLQLMKYEFVLVYLARIKIKLPMHFLESVRVVKTPTSLSNKYPV